MFDYYEESANVDVVALNEQIKKLERELAEKRRNGDKTAMATARELSKLYNKYAEAEEKTFKESYFDDFDDDIYEEGVKEKLLNAFDDARYAGKQSLKTVKNTVSSKIPSESDVKEIIRIVLETEETSSKIIKVMSDQIDISYEKYQDIFDIKGPSNDQLWDAGKNIVLVKRIFENTKGSALDETARNILKKWNSIGVFVMNTTSNYEDALGVLANGIVHEGDNAISTRKKAVSKLKVVRDNCKKALGDLKEFKSVIEKYSVVKEYAESSFDDDDFDDDIYEESFTNKADVSKAADDMIKYLKSMVDRSKKFPRSMDDARERFNYETGDVRKIVNEINKDIAASKKYETQKCYKYTSRSENRNYKDIAASSKAFQSALTSERDIWRSIETLVHRGKLTAAKLDKSLKSYKKLLMELNKLAAAFTDKTNTFTDDIEELKVETEFSVYDILDFDEDLVEEYSQTISNDESDVMVEYYINYADDEIVEEGFLTNNPDTAFAKTKMDRILSNMKDRSNKFPEDADEASKLLAGDSDLYREIKKDIAEDIKRASEYEKENKFKYSSQTVRDMYVAMKNTSKLFPAILKTEQRLWDLAKKATDNGMMNDVTLGNAKKSYKGLVNNGADMVSKVAYVYDELSQLVKNTETVLTGDGWELANA